MHGTKIMEAGATVEVHSVMPCARDDFARGEIQGRCRVAYSTDAVHIEIDLRHVRDFLHRDADAGLCCNRIEASDNFLIHFDHFLQLDDEGRP